MLSSSPSSSVQPVATLRATGSFSAGARGALEDRPVFSGGTIERCELFSRVLPGILSPAGPVEVVVTTRTVTGAVCAGASYSYERVACLSGEIPPRRHGRGRRFPESFVRRAPFRSRDLQARAVAEPARVLSFPIHYFSPFSDSITQLPKECRFCPLCRSVSKILKPDNFTSD